MASKKELKARIKELEGSRVAWTEACVQRTREADEHYERQKQAEARVAELEAELAAERAKLRDPLAGCGSNVTWTYPGVNVTYTSTSQFTRTPEGEWQVHGNG